MTSRDDQTLLTACLQGKEHKALQCLTLGCNVNVKEDGTGSTPLHKASRGGHQKVVLLLLEHGANKYVRNNQNKLASEIAKTKEIADIIHHFHKQNRTGPVLHSKPKSPRIEKHVFHRKDNSDRDYLRQVQYQLIQQQKTIEKQNLIIEEQRQTICNIQREQQMMRNKRLTEPDIFYTFKELEQTTPKDTISVYKFLQILLSIETMNTK